MDSKKFLQLVEEKQKKALEKKQARLEWEEKLEEAAKTVGRGEKRSHRKHKRNLPADSSDEANTNRKNGQRHKKKRSSSSDSSDDEGCHRDGRADRKAHGKHRRRASDESDTEREHRSRRRHRRRHKSSSRDHSDRSQAGESEKRRSRRRHKSSSHDLSDSSEDIEYKKRNRRRHRRRGPQSGSSDYDELSSHRRHKHRDTDSDISEQSDGKRKHDGRKHRRHFKRLEDDECRGSASLLEEEDGECSYKQGDSMERWELGRHRGDNYADKSERHMQNSMDVEKLDAHHIVNEANGKEGNHPLYKKHDMNGK